MQTYSSNAVNVALSAMVSALLAALNEKGVLTTPEAGQVVLRAYQTATGGSPELSAEIQEVLKDMFPNVSLKP